MTERKLRKLNAPFREFGVTHDGRPRFRWMHTTEMEFLLESGMEERLTEGGLLVGMVKTFDRHSYAEIYGPCWILARWQEPINPVLWRARFGDGIPWPRDGEYHPIDNVRMPPVVEPKEIHSEVACMAIRSHLKKIGQALKEEVDEDFAREMRHVRNDIHDEMVEDENAFFNPKPGARGGPVSFGGLKEQGARVQ